MKETRMTDQPTDPAPPTGPRRDPGMEWVDSLNPDADYTPGDVYQPHDGQKTDYNLHYADMEAGPRPEFDPAHTGPLPTGNPAADASTADNVGA